MKKLFTSLIGILFVVILNAQYTNSYTYPFYIGKVGTSTGSITLRGITSGTVQITVPDIAGAGTIFKLPASNGTSGYVLRTDGAGVLSWIPLTGYATLASPTFTGTVTIPTPFTLGAVSVTSTGTQLNYLSGTTGTTGTGNVVLSASPTLSGTVALGSGSITMTGSIGATGAGKLTKIWTVDGEFTNLPTINGGTLKTGLGVTTVGDAFMTLVNPSAITFPRIDAANTVTARSAANFKADLSLENVTNESKATMFTTPTFTGHPTIEGVTATGATGTGNLVFGTAPTISNATLTGNTQINDSIPFADALYAETREFNIQDYGAIENDANEDQTAINAAITAAAAYSGGGGGVGGTVIIPAGDWIITASIIIKSYVTVLCAQGAYFHIPNAYASCVITSNDVALQDFWWFGGFFYGPTKTWNFADLISSADAKRIVLTHFKDIKIYGCKIAFNVTITNDGWCNANIFDDIIIWNPITFLKTRDAVAGGVGFDGNIFDKITIQADVDLVNAIDSLCGDQNMFNDIFVWDLAGAQHAFVTTTGAANNIFIGNFGTGTTYYHDNGTNNFILNQGLVKTRIMELPSLNLTYVSASNGITATSIPYRTVYFNEGGPVDITANPQIVDGTDGQYFTIIGDDDAGHTLTLDDGNGLKLANSNRRIIDDGQTIDFIYNSTLDKWVEDAPRNVVQVKSFTIGWDGATGTDFKWTGDANHTAQNLDLGAVIPAKSEIIQVVIVCTETLTAGGAIDITLRAGNASAGEQFKASASCDDINESLRSTAVLTDAVVMNWASATNIWIGGDPDVNWDTMTAGKWTVYVTYRNYTNF